MIDYWEALGRLVYEDDLFRDNENKFGAAKEIPWIQLEAKDPATGRKYTSTGLDIKPDEIRTVQDFLSPILADRYLSTFAAAELIWTFQHQKDRDTFVELNKIVSKALPTLYSPPGSYFVIQGLILVDAEVRAKAEANRTGEDHALARLSAQQQKRIVAPLKDDKFRDTFRRLLMQFEARWTEGCAAKLICREDYAHPVVLNRSKQTKW